MEDFIEMKLWFGLQSSQGDDIGCGKTKLLLMVGPEGDWTADEVAQLKDAGAVAVGLGPNRLRVETAALSILTAAMLHFDMPVTSSVVWDC
jgi:RsmE family RNA methyltransferase